MDRMAELKNLIIDAEARGWVYIGDGTVRRSATHRTPDTILKGGFWSGATYESHEFLSFVFTTRARVPRVIHKASDTPWTTCRNMSISYKRACEMLSS